MSAPSFELSRFPLFILCFWFAFVTLPGGFAQAEPEAQSRALRLSRAVPLPESFRPAENFGLFVGVNTFQKESGLQNLRYAVNDAIALAHALVIEFEVIKASNAWIALSGEPTTEAFRAQLDALRQAGVTLIPPLRLELIDAMDQIIARATNQQSMIFSSFSSHGFESEQTAFIMPMDGRAERWVKMTGVPLNEIEASLRAAAANKRILLVDACREVAGAGSRGDRRLEESFSKALQSSEGTAVILSCGPEEFSWEDERKQQGIFTYYFVEGLRGAAKADGNEAYITLGAIFNYASRMTHEWVNEQKKGLSQRPWKLDDGTAASIPLSFNEALANSFGDLQIIRNDILTLLRGAAPAEPRIDRPFIAKVERYLDVLREQNKRVEMEEYLDWARSALNPASRSFRRQAGFFVSEFEAILLANDSALAQVPDKPSPPVQSPLTPPAPTLAFAPAPQDPNSLIREEIDSLLSNARTLLSTGELGASQSVLASAGEKLHTLGTDPERERRLESLRLDLQSQNGQRLANSLRQARQDADWSLLLTLLKEADQAIKLNEASLPDDLLAQTRSTLDAVAAFRAQRESFERAFAEEDFPSAELALAAAQNLLRRVGQGTFANDLRSMELRLAEVRNRQNALAAAFSQIREQLAQQNFSEVSHQLGQLPGQPFFRPTADNLTKISELKQALQNAWRTASLQTLDRALQQKDFNALAQALQNLDSLLADQAFPLNPAERERFAAPLQNFAAANRELEEAQDLFAMRAYAQALTLAESAANRFQTIGLAAPAAEARQLAREATDQTQAIATLAEALQRVEQDIAQSAWQTALDALPALQTRAESLEDRQQLATATALLTRAREGLAGSLQSELQDLRRPSTLDRLALALHNARELNQSYQLALDPGLLAATDAYLASHDQFRRTIEEARVALQAEDATQTESLLQRAVDQSTSLEPEMAASLQPLREDLDRLRSRRAEEEAAQAEARDRQFRIGRFQSQLDSFNDLAVSGRFPEALQQWPLLLDAARSVDAGAETRAQEAARQLSNLWTRALADQWQSLAASGQWATLGDQLNQLEALAQTAARNEILLPDSALRERFAAQTRQHAEAQSLLAAASKSIEDPAASIDEMRSRLEQAAGILRELQDATQLAELHRLQALLDSRQNLAQRLDALRQEAHNALADNDFERAFQQMETARLLATHSLGSLPEQVRSLADQAARIKESWAHAFSANLASALASTDLPRLRDSLQQAETLQARQLFTPDPQSLRQAQKCLDDHEAAQQSLLQARAHLNAWDLTDARANLASANRSLQTWPQSPLHSEAQDLHKALQQRTDALAAQNEAISRISRLLNAEDFPLAWNSLELLRSNTPPRNLSPATAQTLHQLRQKIAFRWQQALLQPLHQAAQASEFSQLQQQLQAISANSANLPTEVLTRDLLQPFQDLIDTLAAAEAFSAAGQTLARRGAFSEALDNFQSAKEIFSFLKLHTPQQEIETLIDQTRQAATQREESRDSQIILGILQNALTRINEQLDGGRFLYNKKGEAAWTQWINNLASAHATEFKQNPELQNLQTKIRQTVRQNTAQTSVVW